MKNFQTNRHTILIHKHSKDIYHRLLINLLYVFNAIEPKIAHEPSFNVCIGCYASLKTIKFMVFAKHHHFVQSLKAWESAWGTRNNNNSVITGYDALIPSSPHAIS